MTTLRPLGRHRPAATGGPREVTLRTWWPEPTLHTVIRLLRRGGRPIALIPLTDRIALDACQALPTAPITIPGEFRALG